jgi:hypothetical protein
MNLRALCPCSGCCALSHEERCYLSGTRQPRKPQEAGHRQGKAGQGQGRCQLPRGRGGSLARQVGDDLWLP